MRKLKCECGKCNVCRTRERYRNKKAGQKQPGSERMGPEAEQAAPAPREDSEPVDAIAEKEKALAAHAPRRPPGIHQVVVLNRVGIPIEASVYRDGWRICVCVSLGDRNVPGEPAMFYDVNRLKHHPLAFPAARQI